MKKILFALLLINMVSGCGILKRHQNSDENKAHDKYAETIFEREEEKLVLPPNYNLRPAVPVESNKKQ